MVSKFRASYGGIGKLLRSTEMQAEMRRRAEKVAARAIATAPVGERDDPHPGRYKASFRVESGPRGGYQHNRAFGRVINDSPESILVEFGSSRQAAHRTLGRALDAAKD